MRSALSPTAEADPRAFRVLVVDQEPSGCAFLEKVLRQPAYETVSAADGDEAIRIAETRGPFDLLITDVLIQGMRGDELARRLRGSEPGLRILYLTENSGKLFEERTTLWEDEAFVEKPLTVQGLLEAVSLILVGRIPAPRATRVTIPGARVRFEKRAAELKSLSVTGALMQDTEELAVGSTWRIVLELPSERIRLTGQVVSCVRQEAETSGAATLYTIAMAFRVPPAGRRRRLERVVHEAHRD